MSLEAVNAYLEALPEPKKSTMLEVRRLIMEIEPRFEQVFAWRSPQFKLNGRFVVGICAHKNHLTFSPQSPAVMQAHAKDLEGYVTAGSSFQFAIDKPLPKPLLAKLIAARLAEIV
jgi:uncharacterized protein YdhG (YjbR/CyaY superfamily)